MEELTKQYTPEVIDSALMVVRISGVQEIVVGLVCLLISIFLNFVGKHFYIKFSDDDNDDYIPAFLLSYGGAIVIGGFSIVTLINVWNWVAIFEPKLYLAYRVFERIL